MALWQLKSARGVENGLGLRCMNILTLMMRKEKSRGFWAFWRYPYKPPNPWKSSDFQHTVQECWQGDATISLTFLTTVSEAAASQQLKKCCVLAEAGGERYIFVTWGGKLVPRYPSDNVQRSATVLVRGLVIFVPAS